MKTPTPLVIVNFFCHKLGLYSLRARLASSVLTKKAGKCSEQSDYIDLCYTLFLRPPLNYVGWSFAPMQIRQEIQELLSVLSKRNVSAMLEIGTGYGGALFLFTRVMNSNAKLISLDLPDVNFFGGYESFRIPFFTNFAQQNQHIFLVRADSHSASTSSTVKAILKQQKLDFLFIDGDHTYEGIKLDFQMYSPLIRKGGLIALHDICKHPPAMGCNIHKFWNEIKRKYKFQEIISKQNQTWGGIGVLYT